MDCNQLDICTERHLCKDAIQIDIHQSIEQYLRQLDQYRFTTAPTQLPLPLQNIELRQSYTNLGRAIYSILQSRHGSDPSLKMILPGVADRDQPVCQLLTQYKSKYHGSPRDTLHLSVEVSSPDIFRTWVIAANRIKEWLPSFGSLWSDLKIPYDIGRFDIEIIDQRRCWQPERQSFKENPTLRMKFPLHYEIFQRYHNRILSYTKEMFGDDFVSLELELQSMLEDGSTQVAIVVSILPGVLAQWTIMRRRILSTLDGYLSATPDAIDNGRPVAYEVEFVPDYEAPKLRSSHSSLLKNVRMSSLSDDLEFATANWPLRDGNSLMTASLQNHVHWKSRFVFESKEKELDSGYGTSCATSNVTPTSAHFDIRPRSAVPQSKRLDSSNIELTLSEALRKITPPDDALSAQQVATKLVSDAQGARIGSEEPLTLLSDYIGNPSLKESCSDIERTDRWLAASSHLASKKTISIRTERASSVASKSEASTKPAKTSEEFPHVANLETRVELSRVPTPPPRSWSGDFSAGQLSSDEIAHALPKAAGGIGSTRVVQTDGTAMSAPVDIGQSWRTSLPIIEENVPVLMAGEAANTDGAGPLLPNTANVQILSQEDHGQIELWIEDSIAVPEDSLPRHRSWRQRSKRLWSSIRGRRRLTR